MSFVVLIPHWVCFRIGSPIIVHVLFVWYQLNLGMKYMALNYLTIFTCRTACNNII